MLQKIENFIKTQFEIYPNPKLLYHNLEHTQKVVKQCLTISKSVQLTSKDHEILMIAAWFHDVGYLHTYQNHEAKGIEIATDFLKKEGFPVAKIKKIATCIEATEVGKIPETKLAALLKDADLAYGISYDFVKTGTQLRREWERTIKKSYTDADWQQIQYNFLKSIHFYSDYGKRFFQPIANQLLIAINH